MTIPRFFAVLAIALVLQVGVFAWRYEDLLYLDWSAGTVSASEADTFVHYAGEALARPHLTRRQLDIIASAAGQLGHVDYEARALRRRFEMDPSNDQVKLHLADALRRSGHLDEAEALYLSVLQGSGGGTR
jgi:hypothetical protein